LDEIDALPLSLQAKLLTVIEEKRARRLGAVAERQLDVKLIAATPRELRSGMTAGRFRADLYHRLAVVVLDIPPCGSAAVIWWDWRSTSCSNMCRGMGWGRSG
jgi:transcriptional regulator with PAS, ATPase and Fis domain